MALAASVVITGASGFVGRHLVSALVRDGADVLAVTRKEASFPSGVRHVRVDDYVNTPRQAGAVLVHLAGEAATQSAGRGDADGEIRAALALLERGFAHVIFASSALVFGDRAATAHRTDESVSPVGEYATRKRTIELEVLKAGGSVARLANVFGPGMATNNVVSDILRQVPGDGPIVVRDSGPVRDFVWIEDVVVALGRSIIRNLSGIVHLGSGQGTSVHRLAETAAAVAGQPGRLVVSRNQPASQSTCILDISDTTEKLLWSPQVSLQDGLRRMMGAM